MENDIENQRDGETLDRSVYRQRERSVAQSRLESLRRERQGSAPAPENGGESLSFEEYQERARMRFNPGAPEEAPAEVSDPAQEATAEEAAPEAQAEAAAFTEEDKKRAGGKRFLNVFSFIPGVKERPLTEAELAAERESLAEAQEVIARAPAVAADIGTGVTEVPAQTWNAFSGAVNETWDLAGEMANWIETSSGIDPRIYWDVNADGKAGDWGFSISTKARNEWLQRRGMTREEHSETLHLPQFDKADSVTGQMYEGVARFVFGFLGAGKATGVGKALGNSLPGKISSGMIKGFMADFTVFDGNEGRLSDLLAEVPVLQEIVPEYMQGSENDEELTGRFKNALEGLGLGVLAEGLFQGVRTLRSARKAKLEGVRAVQQAEEAAGLEPRSEAEIAEAIADEGAERELEFLGRLDETEIGAEGRLRVVERARELFAAMTPEKAAAAVDALQKAVAGAQTAGDALVETARTIRSMKPKRPVGSRPRNASDVVDPSAGRRLAAWIVHEGGLSLDDGFTDSVISGVGGRQRRVGLFQNGGKKPEAMYERAIEAGYIPEGSSFDDFVEALSRDVNGDEVWGRADADYVTELRAYEEAKAAFEAQYRSVDPEDAAPARVEGEPEPRKNPYMGRKSFRGAEESRGPNPNLGDGSTLRGMIDDANEEAVQRRLDDAVDGKFAKTVRNASVRYIDPNSFEYNAFENRPEYGLNANEAKAVEMARNNFPNDIIADELGISSGNSVSVILTRARSKLAGFGIDVPKGYAKDASKSERIIQLLGLGLDAKTIADRANTSVQFVYKTKSVLKRQGIATADGRFALRNPDEIDGIPNASLEELRSAGREAYGNDYAKLEKDGRIAYAERASDIDPKYAEHDETAQAFTDDNGNVTIFTETTTPEQIEGIVLHETGIHSGMRGMIGQDGFDSLLSRVDELLESGDEAVMRARENVPDDTPAELIREEMLAYLVQHAPKHGVVREIVAKVKAWVAREFPGLIDRLKLKEPDFRQLALLAVRNEAVVSGEVVARFGPIGDVYLRGQGPKKNKPMFNLSGPLVLNDRVMADPAYAVQSAFDLRIDPLPQIADMQEGLLSSGFMERLFQNAKDFDPFRWREAVESAAGGDEVAGQFVRNTIAGLPPVRDADLPQISVAEVREPQVATYFSKKRGQEGTGPHGISVDDDDEVIRQWGNSEQNPELPLWEADEAAGVNVDMGGGRSVYINMNRIDVTSDEKTVLQQVADQFKDEIDADVGLVSDNQAMLDAIDRDGFEALSNRRKGTPLGKVDAIAARLAWHASGKSLAKALSRLASNPDSAALQFAVNRQMAMHRALQAELLGARADASRALAAWAIPLGDGGAPRMRELTRRLEEMGDDATTTRLVAKMAGLLEDAGELTPGKASKLIEPSIGKKLGESFTETFRNFLLAGTQTHTINIIGNAVFLGRELTERALAGTIAKLTGDELAAGMIKESAESWQGVTSALKDMMVYGAKTARIKGAKRVGLIDEQQFEARMKQATSERPFIDVGMTQAGEGRARRLSSDYWNIPQRSIPGVTLDAVGSVINIPQTLLGGMDTFFKTLSHRAELHSLAGRQAREALDAGRLAPEDYEKFVSDLIGNPTREMEEAAQHMAQRRTFTNPAGPATKAVGNVRDWARPLGLPVGHLLMPFLNTPSNLLRESFRRGPTGLLFPSFREELMNGGYESYRAMSQLALGTGVLMLGIDQAMSGNVTGAGPRTPGQRDLYERNGLQPYSITIGEHKISYSRLDPVVGQFALGADMAEIWGNTDWTDDSAQEINEYLTFSTFMVANTLKDKLYLRGTMDFMEAFSDPRRHSENTVNSLITAMTVPAIVGQAERAIDPQMREAHDVLSTIKNRLPFYSEELPVSLDLWGRERTSQSHIGQFYDVLSPFAARKMDPEPIDTELINLRLAIARPQRTISVAGTSVSLKNHPEIYTAILERGGPRAKDILNEVVSGQHEFSPVYQGLDDFQKRQVIREMVSRSYRQARAEVLDPRGEYFGTLIRLAREKEASMLQLTLDEKDELGLGIPEIQ